MIDQKIISAIIHEATGLETQNLEFFDVGDIAADHNVRLLSYIKSERFLEKINGNAKITGAFCHPEVAEKLSTRITPIPCNDPNAAFFSMIDYLGSRYLKDVQSEVDCPVKYDSIFIDPIGVKISENVIIEPNVTIHRGVNIARDVVIRAGAVLGLDSFQHQRTDSGIISPAHNGFLFIEEGVEIGAHNSISKGFSYRPTRICSGAKLDAQVYIAHGAHIGAQSFICAGARIMGHAFIEKSVFIGPGVVVSSRVLIGEDARVSLGAIVTRNIGGNEHVSGNFAIPHELFIERLKNSRES